jgi:hypothetical protein
VPGISGFCRLCALPLPEKSGYLVLRLTKERLRGITMKYLSLVLVLVLCGVASLATAPARAFEIQGENASLQDGSTPFISKPNQFINSDYSKGSSLALPYIGSADSDYISDYGNAIPIPGPGIDRPSPAWAYSPRY